MDRFSNDTWEADIVQLLEDHHLVILSDQPAQRRRAAARLASALDELSNSLVIRLHGRHCTTLEQACAHIACAIGHAPPDPPSIDALIELLRDRPAGIHRRCFVWQDADLPLDADLKLFSRLVNALMGVCAESEFVSGDMLVIERVVFIGDEKLGAYAEDQAGQFQTWLIEDEDSPFWEAVTCVERPRVLTYRMDG